MTEKQRMQYDLHSDPLGFYSFLHEKLNYVDI